MNASPTGRGGAAAENAADELRNVVERAEELLGSLGSNGGDAVRELRERVSDTVRGARARLGDVESQARDAARYAVDTADEYLRDNPWTAVAVGAAAGIVIGALLARRY